jgi:carbon-monoxide dehydrogenase medium subunit
VYPSPIAHYSEQTTVIGVLNELREAAPPTLLAGGMSVMQAIKSRLIRPEAVLDLNRIADLSGIESTDKAVIIGAMTRYVDIAANSVLRSPPFAALSDAAAGVGDRQVRNRGTLGGSLCWNYFAACCPCAALAVDAELTLVSIGKTGSESERTVYASDFLIGPLETSRKPDEVLVSIHLLHPKDRTGSAYFKWGLVTDALPVVGIAVRVAIDKRGICIGARVAVSGLLNASHRYPEIEHKLIGVSGIEDAEPIFAELSVSAPVHSDSWASAAYRIELLRRLGMQAFSRALERAKGY